MWGLEYNLGPVPNMLLNEFNYHCSQFPQDIGKKISIIFLYHWQVFLGIVSYLWTVGMCDYLFKHAGTHALGQPCLYSSLIRELVAKISNRGNIVSFSLLLNTHWLYIGAYDIRLLFSKLLPTSPNLNGLTSPSITSSTPGPFSQPLSCPIPYVLSR